MRTNVRTYIMFFLLFLYSFSFANEEIKTVLVLHSYHKGFYWTDSITNGIVDTLGIEEDVEIFFEYLDLKRNSDKNYLDNIKELYELKKKNYDFDGIIVSDNLALDFVVKNRPSLFQGIPIVFCGINNYNKDLLLGEKNISGIVERVDYKGTLDLMKNLHKNSKNVLIITDTTSTGQMIKKELEEITAAYNSQFKFEIFDNYTISSLENKLEKLPEDTLVYALLINKTSDGDFISYPKGKEILKFTKQPVYLGWEFYFGQGAIGGKMTSGYLQGKLASNMMLEVFKGINLDETEVKMNFTSEYKIDFKALKKFSLEKIELPINTIVVNKPLGFLKKNIKNIILGLISIFFLMIIIFFKLRFNRKQRNEKANLTHELESMIKERTTELEQVKQKILNQQNKLVKQAYSEGFTRVKVGIIHNIGNVINPLHLALQSEIDLKTLDKETEIRFFEEILYPELIKDEIDLNTKEKFIKLLPKILQAMKEKKYDELSRLRYLKKEIEHLKGIVKLQKNYVGTLGTESYFRVNEIIKEVVEKRGIDYRVNLELELNTVGEVLVDKTQMFQVFDNIIKNQVEDLLVSEKTYKLLRVSTSENDKNVKVIVSDNGDLYPESFSKRIFDLSFITKEKNRKNFELYGCYQIVKKYGGNIKFISNSRKGNVFEVEIPKR